MFVFALGVFCLDFGWIFVSETGSYSAVLADLELSM